MTILIIAICILVAAAFIALYCFHICFYAANNTPQDPYGPLHGKQNQAVQDEIYEGARQMEAVPHEAVSTTSFDGLKLTGQYYHTKDNAPVMIFFHGYRSMPYRDAPGSFTLAQKMGINLLTVDQRAHGGSDGHVITFGVLERHDCLAWIRYIQDRFDENVPIILSGLSMGAATVVMATSLPLPENVLCVLADCPYSDPREIICKVCRDFHMPAAFFDPFIRLAARLFGKFDLKQCSAIDAVKDATVPILLIHGEDDRFVPCDMSRQIQQASNGLATLVSFPEAGHGLSYIIDPKRYEKSILDFLQQFPQLESYIHAANV